MKKVSGIVRVYCSCAFLLIATAYCPTGSGGTVHALFQRMRGTIKDWVYRGWIRNDNFFEIIPGELYRSSQLLPSRLEEFIKQYGIKTIVNLSGDEPYYWISALEKDVAKKHNIVLFSIKTHALIITPLEQVRTLLTISLCSPLPILIHCFAGRDRTGEACALYMLATDRGLDHAITQLSPRFGHKKWLFPFKYYLITNIEKVYPGLISNLKQLCDTRFSYNDLKDIQPEELYNKIIDGTIYKKKLNNNLPDTTASPNRAP